MPNDTDKYLTALEERMKAANSCKALSDAARDAMESLQQGLNDANAKVQSLTQLIIPPTTLPGVIVWIKAVIETYTKPYETYVKQVVLYTEKLTAFQNLLSEKMQQLACQDSVIPAPPEVP